MPIFEFEDEKYLISNMIISKEAEKISILISQIGANGSLSQNYLFMF